MNSRPVDSTLGRLAALAGIAPRYVDAWGEVQETDDETRTALLNAMGFPCATDPDRLQCIERLEADLRQEPMPRAIIVRHRRRKPVDIFLRLPELAVGGTIDWHIAQEDGKSMEGQIGPDALSADGESGTTLSLPVDPPYGYHRLRLNGARVDAETTLVVAPTRCYLPRSVTGKRLWGLGTQLYSLRSDGNWGIGDYSDLSALIQIASRLGADFIGLNPLHALFPGRPEHASPYSPSSRAFVNGLYLDIERVPGFSDCRAAQEIYRSADFQSALRAARAAGLVDYAAVSRLKQPVLHALYREFRDSKLQDSTIGGGTMLARAFRRFQKDGGRRLELFGTFEALSEHFGSNTGWRDWPAPYRDPKSPEVAEFARDHREQIEFSHYAQWLCREQLRAAVERAETLGMAVGLYHDVALAADWSGADAWMNQHLLARGASLGAPPDAWNLKGQNWGITPRSPFGLRRDGYRTEAAILAANMRHGGALRLDHVMAFQRLYWIPDGAPPSGGAYVRYPYEDLLGILALESRRAKCVVIGEDLGTVPDGFRARMKRENILSYRLLFFEREASGALRRPRQYPAKALASATTHDLATLPGFWKGRDLAVRSSLDLFPTPKMESDARNQRMLDRARLVRALTAEGLLPEDFRAEDFDAMPVDAILAVYRYLARTPSIMLAVHLEDPLGVEDQPNLPGTVDSHPNWRRKLPLELERLSGDPRIVSLADAIGAIRPRQTGKGTR